MAELGAERPSALEISGTVWKDHGFARYRSTSYPEYDVTAAPLEERFDLVIAEHVLEHLPRPYAAARNVLAMLAPGGAFLVVTPFLYEVHPCPDDCTRWTESGLRHFLAEAGYDEARIRTGAWGNRACIASPSPRASTAATTAGPTRSATSPSTRSWCGRWRTRRDRGQHGSR